MSQLPALCPTLVDFLIVFYLHARCSLSPSVPSFIFPFSFALCHPSVENFHLNRLHSSRDFKTTSAPLWLTDWQTDRKDLDLDSPFEWFGVHKWLKKIPLAHLLCYLIRAAQTRLGGQLTLFDRPQERKHIQRENTGPKYSLSPKYICHTGQGTR